jgi:hypothetical protein
MSTPGIGTTEVTAAASALVVTRRLHSRRMASSSTIVFLMAYPGSASIGDHAGRCRRRAFRPRDCAESRQRSSARIGTLEVPVHHYRVGRHRLRNRSLVAWEVVVPPNWLAELDARKGRLDLSRRNKAPREALRVHRRNAKDGT